MKTSFSYILLLFVTGIYFGCGNAKHTEESSTSTASKDSITVAPSYLEGLYATSTQLPLNQYALENIFDGDASTSWQTMKGAGPDEGFVLYFPQRIWIKQLELAPATGADVALIKSITVYADGHSAGEFDPSKPISLDQELQAIFIKVTATDQDSVMNVGGESDEESVSLETFNRHYAVGFSEVKIMGKDGTLSVQSPLAKEGTVTASSVLAPQDAYAAAQLFDARKEFVWAEGAKGNGENEKLTFAFKKPQHLSALRIWNGYQRSQKHFESNARIKSFEFGLKDGAKTTYNLADAMDPQTITLTTPVDGKDFELIVKEVYKGTTYQDLVVSELLFYDDNQPVIIKDETREHVIQSSLASAKGSVLEQYLDKRLKNNVELPYSTDMKSLILRSNKTFVLYDHSNASDDSKSEDREVVADGNWDIVQQSETSAKVKIFGKLFNLSQTTEYYKGNESTEVIKIFQDNLTITPEEVTGEKYVDRFYNIADK